METWTIQKVLTWTTGFFEKVGIEKPRLDAELILAHVLDVPRIQLIIDAARPLVASELAAYKTLILRRHAHEPLAYLLGQREFWSLPLSVTPHVLIPRPDTECLVERVLEFIDASKKNTLPCWLKPAVSDYSCEVLDEKRAYYEAIEAAERAHETTDNGATPDPAPHDAGDPPSHTDKRRWTIADIGTGSGAIALAIASELPVEERKIIAIDISCEALSVAQSNAQKLALEDNVNFIHSDLFENYSKISELSIEKFDIIVSNPPYIKTSEMASLMPEVKREPKLALEAGCDGLDVYRRLVPEAYRRLTEGGMLIVEIGSTQGQSVAELFQNAGFLNVRILNDYADLPRNVVGIR